MDFRVEDVLAFHRRDAQEVAEQVRAASFAKGLMWFGAPACLCLSFGDGQAEATLDIDGSAGTQDALALELLVRRMLGLTQAVDAFERTWCTHPQLGGLIARRPGLRVPLAATPFEAVTWAITGQQISVTAAVTIRRRLILSAGLVHSGGLICYPDAARVSSLSDAELRAAGFSHAKAKALVAFSEAVLSGALPLDQWVELMPPVEDIRAGLLAVPGIGPWTVSYALLRGFGWLDGSLHGDVAVRRGLERVLGRQERIAAAEAERWLAGFSPWRALVAAHLWAQAGEERA
jgi:DNA-3-methyladenine glycosylase II